MKHSVPMKDSPVEHLLEELKASLHAERASVLERVERIQRALGAYRTSAEERIAHEFAVQHGLKRPQLGPLSARQAAERLRSLVLELPELAAVASAHEPPAPRTPSAAEQGARDESASAGGPLPALAARAQGRKLVVVGALAGRTKFGVIPPQLAERVEWVDTERDGVHAIGNLPQRIKQGRVAAVVILDRAVQHKHTDPLVAAARDSHTPIAFAGKGGRVSLLRALRELDERLAAQ